MRDPIPLRMRASGTGQILRFDFDIDPRRQVQVGQRIHRFRRRIDDVDQPFVGAHLVLLAGVLVGEGRTNNGVTATFGRQRHRTFNRSAGTDRSIDNRFGRLVDDLVIVGADFDPQTLVDFFVGRRERDLGGIGHRKGSQE